MKNKLIETIKNHWIISILLSLILVTILVMTYMGTLSYPYIMAERQVQMFKYCRSEHSSFMTKDFEFTFEAPEGYCFLPNREFPKDTTVQVLPSGLYSVLNEYIKGTVVSETRATIIFEPLTKERNPETVVDALSRGGFLEGSKREDFVNKNGVKIVLVRGARGIETEERSDWAFVLNKKGNKLLTLLLNKTDKPEVFNYLLENLSTR